MQNITCQVVEVVALTNYVSKVILQPEKNCEFEAGQYLQVVMGENDKRPFSIANAPQEGTHLELHIGASPDNAYAFEVLTTMQQRQEITADIGLGSACWDKQIDKPMILMAGGTGYSYARSILFSMLASNVTQDIYFYWGTKSKEEMYAFDELNELAQAHENLTFVPVFDSPSSDWQGKQGWVHHAVMADFPDLSSFRIYLAGRFDMAKVAKDDFLQQGLLLEDLHGDAYAFI